jgi:DNA topoisomerase-3
LSKTLIIAEKPSVAKDIAVALGGFQKEKTWFEREDAVISSAIGHLVELDVPEAATGGRDLSSLPVVPDKFGLRVIERTKDQYALLDRLMRRKDITTVVNACDAGREGELIFRLIYEMSGCRKPTNRMWLQSMTPGAIRAGYANMRPGHEFNALADAARCRGEADWLIGINGSRGITKLREKETRTAEQMNAGRVQTPTLAILVFLEQTIRNFVPQDYWEVHGTFGAKAGNYDAKWFNPQAKEEGEEGSSFRILDQAKAASILSKCVGVVPTSVIDTSKPQSRAAPRLFDLTSLQREANKRFKYSAKKTLDIAQALYEKHKVTTYPRTDSTALPEDYVGKAAAVMKCFSGTGYAPLADKVIENQWLKPDKRIFDNAKISDHFAIIPNGQKPQNLDAHESKIYDLIVRRFLAAFFPPAIYEQTVRITVVSDESFKSTGKVLVTPGWLEVYGTDVDDDTKAPRLCVVDRGEVVKPINMSVKSLKTKPPARLTEATLLSAMESAGKFVDDDDLREAMKGKGLGTPATRASIIEGLLADQDNKGRAKEPYIRRDDNHLVPTGKGMGLIDFLVQNNIEVLTSPRMTGDWEQKLRLMEQGKYSRPSFMAEIGNMTSEILKVIKAKASTIVPSPEASLSTCCPLCAADLAASVRTIDCQAGCGFQLWLSIAEKQLTLEQANTLLRDRELPVMSGFYSKAKKKKFSAGLSLNDEGKVTFVFPKEGETTSEQGTKSGEPVECPTCHKAMRRLKGSKGHFWGCSGYSEGCRTTMDDRDGKAVPRPTSKPSVTTFL